MAINRLKDVKPHYDAIVIGSGLGGLTAANHLAKSGHSVLLLEHHYQFGGLATWFRRKHHNVFDISLHGFPAGMIKSCRRYWTQEIADLIYPLKSIRFKNPDFDIETPFDQADFTQILVNQFGQTQDYVESFYAHLKQMSFFDEDERTTGDLLEEFFPKRPDIHRLLLEPIAFANGSNLSDPAFTFGIVFTNFMNKGVYIFRGGADKIIGMMVAEAQANGVDARKFCQVESILTETTPEGTKAAGVIVNGERITADTVISNANLKRTILELTDSSIYSEEFLNETKQVRLNTSSCQVYMGFKKDYQLPELGDIVFTSQAKPFSSQELTSINTSSRTFSIYRPEMRPGDPHAKYAVVASLNAKWSDWENLDDQSYQAEKERLCEEAKQGLEQLAPGTTQHIDWIEAATPRTVNRFTQHVQGATFGTKFEGLKVSQELPNQVQGLFHAGSVGIIMSGWLGTINYGVIIGNKADEYLRNLKNQILIDHAKPSRAR